MLSKLVALGFPQIGSEVCRYYNLLPVLLSINHDKILGPEVRLRDMSDGFAFGSTAFQDYFRLRQDIFDQFLVVRNLRMPFTNVSPSSFG